MQAHYKLNVTAGTITEVGKWGNTSGISYSLINDIQENPTVLRFIHSAFSQEKTGALTAFTELIDQETKVETGIGQGNVDITVRRADNSICADYSLYIQINFE